MGAKEKILKYLEFKGVSQGKFCRQISVSNGFLASGVHIGSDKLKDIRDNYMDLNMDWLIYDEGEMVLEEDYLMDSNPSMANDHGYQYEKECGKCESFEALLESKDETIAGKNETIAILKHQLGINNGNSKAS